MKGRFRLGENATATSSSVQINPVPEGEGRPGEGEGKGRADHCQGTLRAKAIRLGFDALAPFQACLDLITGLPKKWLSMQTSSPKP